MCRRTWCYVMNPAAYDITCDKCGGSHITWSEYEEMIWCYDCKIDTKGDPGIFDGPIPYQLTALLGITFDRINLDTDSLEKCVCTEESITWIPIEEWNAKEALRLLSDGKIQYLEPTQDEIDYFQKNIKRVKK